MSFVVRSAMQNGLFVHSIMVVQTRRQGGNCSSCSGARADVFPRGLVQLVVCITTVTVSDGVNQ